MCISVLLSLCLFTQLMPIVYHGRSTNKGTQFDVYATILDKAETSDLQNLDAVCIGQCPILPHNASDQLVPFFHRSPLGIAFGALLAFSPSDSIVDTEYVFNISQSEALHGTARESLVLSKTLSQFSNIPLPNCTPHNCRHTFSTKMSRKGMYPKNLQYIMSHSDYKVTMNTYTHLDFEDAVKELKRVNGQRMIG